MNKIMALFLCLFLYSCGSGPNWDMFRTIQKNADQSISLVSKYTPSLKRAVQLNDGKLVDSGAGQILYLQMGTADNCTDPNRIAYSDINDDNTISLCPTNEEMSQTQLDATMMHEFGHILGKRIDHLPCATQAIMTPANNCRPGVNEYLQIDFDYMCQNGNVLHQKCSN